MSLRKNEVEKNGIKIKCLYENKTDEVLLTQSRMWILVKWGTLIYVIIFLKYFLLNCVIINSLHFQSVVNWYKPRRSGTC